MNNILVVGSLNMDIVNRVEKHPKIGETIKGISTSYYSGGKGSNQAVAASKLGANVKMMGAVGDDQYGKILLKSLNSYDVNIESVVTLNEPTGIAFITVDSSGENTIILSEGANKKITVDNLKEKLSFVNIDTLLVQNEINFDVTKFVIEEAHCKGIHTIYNPAPVLKLDSINYSHIGTLVVNVNEAEHLTGFQIINREDAFKAAKLLLDLGVSEVIITLGGSGSIYINQNNKCIYENAFKVDVVDTTAAGDTFIGAFSAVRGEESIENTLKIATVAAALSVTKTGAQESIPSIFETKNFLKQNQSFNARKL
jgi:ribokinase